MKKIYIFFVVILSLLFLIFYYKNLKDGNNIIKPSEEEIIDNILSSELKYKAEVKIKIYSNKNENEYRAKIVENGDNSSLEIIGDRDEISGLKLETTDGKLIIKNTKLNLEKIYEDFKPVTNNCLFLSSFSDEYRNNSENSQSQDGDNLKINLKLKNSSKYIKYKELILNKNTGLPEKLIIKASSKQLVVCIEYINIEIL